MPRWVKIPRTEEEMVRQAYETRNKSVKQLGYSSYQEYLASDDWKKIREEILVPGTLCLVCDCPAQVVHHVRYTTNVLLGLTPSRLAPLCHRCHEQIEIAADGSKRRMSAANEEMFRLAAKTPHGSKWTKTYVFDKQAREYEKRARQLGMDRGRRNIKRSKRAKKTV